LEHGNDNDNFEGGQDEIDCVVSKKLENSHDHQGSIMNGIIQHVLCRHNPMMGR